jgi:hypothetical protein
VNENFVWLYNFLIVSKDIRIEALKERWQFLDSLTNYSLLKRNYGAWVRKVALEMTNIHFYKNFSRLVTQVKLASEFQNNSN